jgi:hypothetical protein
MLKLNYLMFYSSTIGHEDSNKHISFGLLDQETKTITSWTLQF